MLNGADPVNWLSGCTQSFVFSTDEWPISVYGALDTNSELGAVGFVKYDQSVLGCSCDYDGLTAWNALSGSVELSNTLLPFYEDTELYLDTSDLVDTASTTTTVTNFCGQYDFVVDSSPTAGLLSTWDFVELCESDCGYYNNYTVATAYPTYLLDMPYYDFSIDLSLRNYPNVAVLT